MGDGKISRCRRDVWFLVKSEVNFMRNINLFSLHSRRRIKILI